MAYKQVKAFNQSKATHTAGACLVNVRTGYGINSKYPNAWSAWEHTDQHTDAIPTGVDVPLYFSYKDANNGHIGVHLADGRFWSDGTIYASVAAYNASGHTPQYRGWSTSVDGVAVIQQVVAPTPPAGLDMPAIGSRIQLIPKDVRTTFKAGTASKAGVINVTDNTFKYVVRGYDAKYPGRILINSASAGGDGVGLALYYVGGAKIPGWQRI